MPVYCCDHQLFSSWAFRVHSTTRKHLLITLMKSYFARTTTKRLRGYNDHSHLRMRFRSFMCRSLVFQQFENMEKPSRLSTNDPLINARYGTKGQPFEFYFSTRFIKWHSNMTLAHIKGLAISRYEWIHIHRLPSKGFIKTKISKETIRTNTVSFKFFE